MAAACHTSAASASLDSFDSLRRRDTTSSKSKARHLPFTSWAGAWVLGDAPIHISPDHMDNDHPLKWYMITCLLYKWQISKSEIHTHHVDSFWGCWVNNPLYLGASIPRLGTWTSPGIQSNVGGRENPHITQWRKPSNYIHPLLGYTRLY